jgi:hypothetical protein
VSTGPPSEPWVADPFGQPLDVEWKKEGDEWVDHLLVALAQEVPHKSRSARPHKSAEGVPAPHVEWRVDSEQLNSSLRLIPLKRGIYVLVTGEGDAPSASEVDPWSRAAQEATQRVGRTHHDFRWSAVIGPQPAITSAGQVLQEDAAVGGLELRPGGTLLYEFMPAGFPSFYAGSTFFSGPVIVAGCVRGYGWGAASVAAARQLHRLCAILSVAWDSAWVVREAPALDELGAHDPEAVAVPARGPGCRCRELASDAGIRARLGSCRLGPRRR